MDPFIIIRNYRHSRLALDEPQPQPLTTPSPPAPRLFLRELDPNTLVSRGAPMKRSVSYCEEDKENYYSLLEMDHREELIKKLPTPNQSQLINYADYDLN